MTAPDAPRRVVGSERVLAVLVELASLPTGATLEDLAGRLGQNKATVHHALGALCRSGLATRSGRGHYVLGDEFLRLAFAHYEARPEDPRVRPLMRHLADRFGETVHLATLDGHEVVYRAKVDPASGTVTGWIDLSALTAEVDPKGSDDVANGIAWDAKGKRLFVTGKDWPTLFEIALPAK